MAHNETVVRKIRQFADAIEDEDMSVGRFDIYEKDGTLGCIHVETSDYRFGD